MDQVARLSERKPHFYGEDGYRRSLRAPARGLWLDTLSKDQFMNAMIIAIERGLNSAWAEGAHECGIGLDELSAEETQRLKSEIYGQFKYIVGLGEFIEAHSKARKGAWGDVDKRLDLWVNRYRAVRSLAAAMACKDKKKVFARVRATLKPCRSCSGLEGRVYRYSVWLANDAIPPSSRFECHGWRCGHELQDTDRPITKGPFPKRLLINE
jgi:hypothetical protein